jgi:lipoprotein-anchoring transpeptidase ErfK/SrfK
VKLKRDAALAATVVAFGALVAAGATNNPIKHVAVAPPPTPQIDTKLADNARNVPTSTEIAARVTDGEIQTVTLTDAKGAKVDGAMRADGSAWVPGKPLKHKQTYTAHITATNDKGGKATATRTFTTMAEPGRRTQTTLYMRSGATYGVAMPVTVAFDPPVPKEARAAVQHRLFVTTDPPQPGVWSWIDDGSQVYYRAPDFWKPGTKISVRSALQGLPMGKGRYGDTDHVAAATIAKDKVTMAVDNKTKRMSVFKNDKLIRKVPVSLGKPSTPTSSGKMVIMEKFDQTVFDTTGSADPYVVTVQDAQRLTWGGEFIHSAPWSVGVQGSMNVSHGCTNVSPTDARWLMQISHIGDLVEFTGTEVKLDPGNGWTAWNESWGEYIKGSALPVPAELKSQPDRAPSATPPAATTHPPEAIEAQPSPTKGGR